MTRVARLQQELERHGVDALLVTDPANVRYLSGFTSPDDGRVLVTRAAAVLITDARYQVQARDESRIGTEIRREWIPWLAEQLADARIGVEAEATTLALHEDLSNQLSAELVPLKGVLGEHRIVKDAAELASLRRAAQITDASFDHILGVLAAGVSELDVALELERDMRSRGAEAKGFDIIVASGGRSAMPHGIASRKIIEAGDLVTLDFGAVVDGYHADMTRAVAVGPVSDELRRLHDAVHEALEDAVAGIRPGLAGREADAIARDELQRHGLADRFAHSLGHGVGLQIHEAPRLSPTSDDILRTGMTVTVEPGVYLPDFGGVRIEDLVVLTDDGCERLSRSPRELLTV